MQAFFLKVKLTNLFGTPGLGWNNRYECPGKYVTRRGDDNVDIEVPVCAADLVRDSPETLWAKKDRCPISIAADCAGIGSGIEGVAKICNSHSVSFISEIDDVTRGVCTRFAHPEDIRGNV